MTKISISDIKNKVNEFASKVNAPSMFLPAYERTVVTEYEARPIVEVDNLGFMYYVVSERGQEISKRATNKPDELLYWIFKGVTYSMASRYELENRIEDKDSRRISFAKQAELMGILNATWEEKINIENSKIIKDYPYDDLAGLRATYFRELREQGYPEAEISKMAYVKYPENPEGN